ncbi:hypothetical protein [Nonomuraea sp. NPDC049141]|uniref:hypothetical protein n=1 Tax=Nonomuraea sp. NPDC049141 TaxID=3155500 RepID=UPI0033CC85E6
MDTTERLRFLAASGLVHPQPDAVSAPLFASGGFFLPEDKVQAKYELLRAHAVEHLSPAQAAAAHGYSRSGFYLIKSSFLRMGMTGLLDGRPGRRGPVKMTEEIASMLRDAPATMSGAVLVGVVAEQFGVVLHRRTIERIRRR